MKNVVSRAGLLAALLSGWAPVESKAQGWEGDDAPPAAIVATEVPIGPLLERTRGLAHAERLERISRAFVGRPYQVSPLGEGEPPDRDPRVRYDVFDCLTFAETMLALSASSTEREVLRHLDDIRYGSVERSMATRNHVMESQWVPNNEGKRWIREVGSSLSGAGVVRMTKVFSEASVRRIPAKEMPVKANQLPMGPYTLPMVPIDRMLSVELQIPAGSLLVVVRDDIDKHVSMVTHVGIVFRDARGAFVRHASGAPHREVIDERFGDFVARNKGFRSRPVLGFAIYALQVPGASGER